VINTIGKIIVAHENDMLHVSVMVSVEVQVRIASNMLETIKASTVRASNKSEYCKSI
jgi:hypothetical protein